MAHKKLQTAVALGLSVLLVGCGSDDDGGGNGGQDTNALTGMVLDGPVTGADVEVVADNGDGDVVATAETSDAGGYSVSVPAGAATPLVVRSSGGTEQLPGDATRPADDLTSITEDAGGTANVSPTTDLITSAATDQEDPNLETIKQNVSAAADLNNTTNPISQQLETKDEIGDRLSKEQVVGEKIRNAKQRAEDQGKDPAEVVKDMARDASDGTFNGQANGQAVQNKDILDQAQADVESQTGPDGTLNIDVDGQNVEVNSQNMSDDFGDSIAQEVQTHIQTQEDQGTGGSGGGG